jgi:alpha-1,6-mannosyltransferase
VGFFHSNFPSCYVGRLTGKYFGSGVGRWCERRAWGYARMIYGWCDAVIATSRFSKEALESAQIENVAMIPLGVDTALFDPSRRNGRLRRELGIESRSTILLFVGRVTQEKDLGTLLEAYRRLSDSGDYHLIMIGAGPSAAEIEKACVRVKGIHYLGYRSHENGLADIYASSDIFITASPRETFGLSPLEALASGLPVVGVSGGAVSELLSPQISEVAASSSPESLANAIVSISRRLTPELRLLCRKQVKQKFSWSRTFDAIFSLYGKLIENRTQR